MKKETISDIGANSHFHGLTVILKMWRIINICSYSVRMKTVLYRAKKIEGYLQELHKNWKYRRGFDGREGFTFRNQHELFMERRISQMK